MDQEVQAHRASSPSSSDGILSCDEVAFEMKHGVPGLSIRKVMMRAQRRKNKRRQTFGRREH